MTDIEKIIDECMHYGIPVTKSGGDLYSLATLKKKISDARKAHGTDMSGGESPKPKKTKGTENAIIDDPLVQAYLKKTGEPVREDTTIPLGIIMALYGTHRELEDSGLSDKLPDFLQSEELKDFFEREGIKNMTPRTPIPLHLIYV